MRSIFGPVRLSSSRDSVREIGYIQRGYEHFERKLQALGAEIQLVEDEREAQKFRMRVG